MVATAASTWARPSPALRLVLSASSEAEEALLATSSTETFICSMAVAASAVRWRWFSVPRLDSSIWAESSSAASATEPAMPLAEAAAWAIFSFWAAICACWALSSVRSV